MLFQESPNFLRMLEKMDNLKKYSKVMSFGCMCSTALFLRKNGFRSESTIFDWFSSSLMSNLKMLDDNFEHLLDRKFLCQKYPEFPHIVDNSYYDASLNHLFDEYKPFDKQIKTVQKHCSKRIDRFMKNLANESCLLLYYSRDEKECEWISKNSSLLKDYCKKYHFDFLFVTNYKLNENFVFPWFYIPFNNIHKPYGGEVSFPFEQDSDLINYINERYDIATKKKNLSYKAKKHFLRKVFRFFEKKRGIKLKI